MRSPSPAIPLIDVSSLVTASGDLQATAAAVRLACTTQGFFYVIGHGVGEALQERLEELSRRFFALDQESKLAIRMELGGTAWRGYFPLGDELTSGKPDLKEGLYFGAELGPEDPRVRAGVPLHGANLFPNAVPELRDTVLEYMAAMTELGHSLMRGLSMSLGLAPDYLHDRYTAEPLTLFRIFHYPYAEPDPAAEARYGVGEHTDYGLLTILKQDDSGGLEVKSASRWIEAPPVAGAFVCNIGDMLERLTGGIYRSTPHRVRNTSGRGRLSFPFFFDPSFDASIEPIGLPDVPVAPDNHEERWDHASVHEAQGTYGDYILGKVSKVFPDLSRSALDRRRSDG